MRKLSLAVITFFCQIFGAFAQTDTASLTRKLKIEEVNFVSAYYMQDGNNSAVTGGIGTEKLTDFANTIELKLIKKDQKSRIHNLGIEMGIDHYTSASSDKIDPSTISSPSYADTRLYPSVSYNVNNVTKGLIVGATGSFSSEFDYKSFGLGVNVAKLSKDKNREIGLKLQGYWDTWKVIYPIELRPILGDGGHQPRNSYSASLSLSQVINKKLQIALLADLVYQQGLLATKYQRVYFTDNSETVENLPDTRLKIPLGVRLSYFLSDRFILRAFYRYYSDDWGLTAHTVSLELPIKINPFFSISPFYRYYTQTAADYFLPYKAHTAGEEFYTSDYDLSSFKSGFFGAGFRFTPEKGVFGWKHWAMLELRYGHYTRNTGLHSDILTLSARFK